MQKFDSGRLQDALKKQALLDTEAGGKFEAWYPTDKCLYFSPVMLYIL